MGWYHMLQVQVRQDHSVLTHLETLQGAYTLLKLSHILVSNSTLFPFLVDDTKDPTLLPG